MRNACGTAGALQGLAQLEARAALDGVQQLLADLLCRSVRRQFEPAGRRSRGSCERSDRKAAASTQNRSGRHSHIHAGGGGGQAFRGLLV